MRTRLARLSAALPRLALLLTVAAGLAISPADAATKKAKAKPKPKRAKVTQAAGNPDRDGVIGSYDKRIDVLTFIDSLAQRHGYAPEQLRQTFAQVRHIPMVARLMMPPPTTQPKSWAVYRARFIEPRRIAAGVAYWTQNADVLERAAGQFGVPEEIIVGITGVETIYGRNMGGFRVIDALTTLAFDYPNKERDRSPFFRAQLEDYLLFAREARLDVFDVRGSYAGAIGIPQFMPGSYRRFAIDFDGDQIVNLRGNNADAIGSVANFLREHGWVRGVVPFYRTVLPAGLDAAELKRLVDLGAEPKIRAAELRRLGFAVDAALADDRLVALIDLPNEGEADGRTDYVLGTENFTALTRYNRSYFYAMAVAELGAAVKAQLPR